MADVKLASTQLWVHDQDVALDFYKNKLGWLVRSDVSLSEMPGFRWLTVSPPQQEDVTVVLMSIPGEPIMDAQTRGQVETLMAKGFAGALFLQTEDCDASYEELSARGVEFTEKPTDYPYGRDSSFRDPSGNTIRLAQLKPMD
jgi:predicted enzyme related to lactoylglutathione lyase